MTSCLRRQAGTMPLRRVSAVILSQPLVARFQLPDFRRPFRSVGGRFAAISAGWLLFMRPEKVYLPRLADDRFDWSS